jgi:hypothetical protein
MNFEQDNQKTQSPDAEALEIQKEIFMTSGGIKVGQSMSEYKAEREMLWNKMHPNEEIATEENQELQTGTKPILDRTNQDDQKQAIIKNVEITDQEKLEKVRQDLKINESKDDQKEGQIEKEKIFKEQVRDFVRLAIKDDSFRRSMDKWRSTRFTGETEDEFKKRNLSSDLDMIAIMSKSMYDLIHKSGMTYEEITEQIKLPNKEEFIKNFTEEISDRLVNKVTSSSNVRHITNEELISGGQPDQAAGFVWFKGNALRPQNAREVRFYINASPTGTTNVAEYLSKVSDTLDKYGMRLQFKFRKDLGEYDRTDTCVAYLYMPEANTKDKKEISDQWLEKIKELMAKMPKDSIRDKNSFFTDRITSGVSFAEDTRESSGKKGESYTSQITKSISESAGELSSQYKDLTPEAIEQITLKTVEKLKSMNYF